MRPSASRLCRGPLRGLPARAPAAFAPASHHPEDGERGHGRQQRDPGPALGEVEDREDAVAPGHDELHDAREEHQHQAAQGHHDQGQHGAQRRGRVLRVPHPRGRLRGLLGPLPRLPAGAAAHPGPAHAAGGEVHEVCSAGSSCCEPDRVEAPEATGLHEAAGPLTAEKRLENVLGRGAPGPGPALAQRAGAELVVALPFLRIVQYGEGLADLLESILSALLIALVRV
mmetsp:Transcript_74720/g.211395  ORF Transcript_74720/g.211395 Transcript_74720/m.211395 type:complete len:228 (-) Transcript_74720:197-880(-)